MEPQRPGTIDERRTRVVFIFSLFYIYFFDRNVLGQQTNAVQGVKSSL
jgi:hypothetical protein